MYKVTYDWVEHDGSKTYGVNETYDTLLEAQEAVTSLATRDEACRIELVEVEDYEQDPAEAEWDRMCLEELDEWAPPSEEYYHCGYQPDMDESIALSILEEIALEEVADEEEDYA